MGLKGGRNITVGGHHFKWKFAHCKVWITGDSPVSGDIIVHCVDGPGRLRAKVATTIEVDEYTSDHGGFRATLAPSGVAKTIQKALDDGWDPMTRVQHELDGPLDLGDYAVEAP